MKRLRGSRTVDHSLRAVRQEVRAALKELNQQAGKLMAKGQYDEATELAQRGNSVGEFESKISSLRQEWRSLWVRDRTNDTKPERTPLWEYYQPVLAALTAIGGEARRAELEGELERSLAANLKPGDSKLVGRKRIPRWKLVVRRTRKSMIREKYLEDGPGSLWRITPLGRQIAAGDSKASEK